MRMSEFSNIDHLFESHFAEHEVMVRDRDGLWNRIRPRRRYRFFFLIFFVGVMSASGLYFTFLSEPYDEKNIVDAVGAFQTSKALTQNRLVSPDNHLALTDEQEDVQDPKEYVEQVILLHDVSLKKEEDEHFNDPIQRSDDLSSHTLNATTGEANQGSGQTLISNYLEHSDSEKSNLLRATRLLESLPTSMMEVKLTPPLLNLRKNPLNDCTTFASGRFFGEIYTNLGLPLESLSLNPGFTDQLAYLDEWDRRYSPLASLAAGIGLGYEWKNGLEISGGIEYQRNESQYRTIQTIREVVTIFDPMAYFIVDDQGQIVWIGDDVTAVNIYDEVISVGNQSTFINIPVSVAYPVFRRNQFFVKVVAGGILNLSHSHRGQFLRPDLSLIQVDGANESLYFQPDLGFSVEGGVNIGLELNEQWQLYASPRFRLNRRSYTRSDQAISFTRNFANLRIGLRRNFSQ